MVGSNVLTAKLTELADLIDRIRLHQPRHQADLDDDRDRLDIVAFNLMLSVQTCADIASHILADEGWPAARSLAEAFQRLRQEGVLTASTANALCRAVGLRNVVAHGYARVDTAMVLRAANEGLFDLSAFAREISAWLTTRAQGEET